MAILGIDEVGRGAWAGPLVVGAAILCENSASSDTSSASYPEWAEPLTDSKKLTEKKRNTLSEQINGHAAATALGWVSASELDQIGLSEALRLATRRAVLEIQRQKVPFSEIIIDGTVNFLSDTPLEGYVTILKKADALIKEVSAASIIAKVARDNYMYKLATTYPDYGFKKHVGYGTALHRGALQKIGPTREHRLSFRPVAQISKDFPDLLAQIEGTRTEIKAPGENSATAQLETSGKNLASVHSKLLPHSEASTHQSSTTTKSLGDHAEKAVRNYLISQGHQILTHNHRTKFYEIDIISFTTEKLYFTEVKYRHSTDFGGGSGAVDSTKLKRMHFAAEAFLQSLRQASAQNSIINTDSDSSPISLPTLARLQPALAVATVSGDDFSLEDFLELDFRDFIAIRQRRRQF